MLYFPSRRAVWFHLIALIVMPGATLVPMVAAVWGGETVALLPAVLMLLPAALTLWIWASTGYTFRENDLLVTSGPFRWRVPYAAITNVRPTRNPLSSPALSLDRLSIRYGRGSSLMISPDDRERFLAELRARCPDATIKGD